MVRPVTLSDALSMPDVLDTNRQVIYFPSVPGGDSVDSKYLSIVATNLDVHPSTIATVRVHIFNNPMVWRGQRDSDNAFSVSFYETTGGRTLQSLLRWQALTSNEFTGESLTKDQYAQDAYLIAFDSAGTASYAFFLTACWPHAVQTPQSNEASAPALVSVSFAVDFVDMIWARPQLGTFMFDPDRSNLNSSGAGGLEPSSFRQSGNPPLISQLPPWISNNYNALKNSPGLIGNLMQPQSIQQISLSQMRALF